VFINHEKEHETEKAENRVLFAFQVMVKMFLVCLTTTGLGITLAQVYRIPVDNIVIGFICFLSVITFHVGLMLFKKRALYFPALFFLVMAWWSDGVHSVILFYNHMLHVLDGRLLSTARYARYSWSALTEWTNSYAIAAVFLVICVLICLGFTLASRSRFIGIMLVTTVFLLTPAFGAEIAGYVRGIELMIAGMLGIYAMWVAHAWENAGGVLQLNRPDTEDDENGENGENITNGRKRNKKKKIQKEKEPFFKLQIQPQLDNRDVFGVFLGDDCGISSSRGG
jgi:hypothetical protein